MDFCESKGNILLFVKSLKMASERAVFARCLSLFVAFHSLYCGNAVNTTFGLGAMLSSMDNQKVFQSAVDKINANSSSLLRGAILNASSYVLNPNPIRSAMDVCEKLIANGVAVVIVSHPRDELSPPISVSYACSFYWIPVVGISSRETIFSDKVFFFLIKSIVLFVI